MTPGGFVEQFVQPWLTPFALSVGLLALTLFAFLAAVFLTLETQDPELLRGLPPAGARHPASRCSSPRPGAPALHGAAPLVQTGLMASSWALPLAPRDRCSAVAVLAALWFRRFRLARIAVGLQVSLIFWGWALAQYPFWFHPNSPSRVGGAGHRCGSTSPRPGGRWGVAPAVPLVPVSDLQDRSGRPGRAPGTRAIDAIAYGSGNSALLAQTEQLGHAADRTLRPCTPRRRLTDDARAVLMTGAAFPSPSGAAALHGRVLAGGAATDWSKIREVGLVELARRAPGQRERRWARWHSGGGRIRGCGTDRLRDVSRSRGRGYATEAVRAMVDWAFTQPGRRMVRALAPVWNTPAVHVAEKVGMRPVASDEDDEIGEVWSTRWLGSSDAHPSRA